MNNLVLVNKTHSIDATYEPNDLEFCDEKTECHFNYGSTIRREVLSRFIQLRKDALRMKYDIYVFSGYRSYNQQQSTFDSFFQRNYLKLKQQYPNESEESLRKQAYLLTTNRVALPGQSEHQTGLAMDIACFYNSNYDEDLSNNYEIEWMRDNAHKYGFILRYPKGKEDITGYSFEPWHYRYVGEEHSFNITSGDYTLEEYHERVLRQ